MGVMLKSFAEDVMPPITSGGDKTTANGGAQWPGVYRPLAPIVVGRRNNPLSTNTLLPTRILPPTCASPTAAQQWKPTPFRLNEQPQTPMQQTHGGPPPVHVHRQVVQPAHHMHIPLAHDQSMRSYPLQHMPSQATRPPSWRDSPSHSQRSINSPMHSNPPMPNDALSDSSSSSSSEDTFISSSEDDSRYKPDQLGALVPIKDADPDAMYLDPATELYLSLTAWMAKYGYAPRPSLLRSTSNHRRQSEPDSWPTKKPKEETQAVDEETRESSFAEKVQMQNRLLSTSTISESSASPDPTPSGPLPDYQRSASFAKNFEKTPTSNESSSDAPAEAETNLAREALKEEQRLRAEAAQATSMQAQLNERHQQPQSKENSDWMESQLAKEGDRDDDSPWKNPADEKGELQQMKEDIERAKVELQRLKKRDEQHKEAMKKLEEMQRNWLRRLNQADATKGEVSPRGLSDSPGGGRREMGGKESLGTPGSDIHDEDLKGHTHSDVKVLTFDYLPDATHGVTAISFRLESIAYISPTITDTLNHDCIVYAVVRVGDRDLHSRLREGPVTLEELRSLSVKDVSTGTNRLTWNDVFHFPYINERYLSCTIRLKEMDVDTIRDYLVGAARIDLESHVLQDATTSLQTIQTFDAEGRATSRVVISIVPSTDVLETPCLSVRPQAMDPAAVALNANLSNSFFPAGTETDPRTDTSMCASRSDTSTHPHSQPPSPRGYGGNVESESEKTTELEPPSCGSERRASLDSLEAIMTMVDWRAVSVVAHAYHSIIVTVLGLRGLKLGSRTSAAALAIETSLHGASGVTGSLQSAAHRVQVQRTKKNRLFAFINYNEEIHLSLYSQKTLSFRCWNLRAQPEPVTIADASLDLQEILLSGVHPVKRKLSLEADGGKGSEMKRIGYLDVIIDFSSEHIQEPISTPLQLTQLESKESMDRSSSLGPDNTSVKVNDTLPPPITCHVTIEGYRDLCFGDDNSAHPYVRVKLGSYEARTARGAGKVCRFRAADAQFAFNLDNGWPLQLLTLECFNKSNTEDADRLIGLCALPLTDLVKLPFRSFCGDLRLLNKRGEEAGVVQVDCQLLH